MSPLEHRVSSPGSVVRLLTVWASGIATATSLHAAVDFAKEVEPLLIKRCSECHGPDKQKGALRLDTRAAVMKSGESGKPALLPGKPDESELIRRVTTSDPDDAMPPKGERLTDAEVAALRQWIAEGAVWPEFDARRHWSFAPVVRPELPPVKRPGWGRNEIDRFILARLEQEGLKPQAEADRPTLIRRLSLDLTGLPPTWDEVAAFVADKSPDAYEKLVDRLLDSPHYGENMARGWLDLRSMGRDPLRWVPISIPPLRSDLLRTGSGLLTYPETRRRDRLASPRG